MKRGAALKVKSNIYDLDKRLRLTLGEKHLGSVCCEIEDNDYNTSLILLGSNFFDGLGVTADFDKRRVYIKRKYPVKLFDSDEAALAQIRKINSDYTTREIVKIILDKRITIEPWERKQLEVFLKEEQAETLENKWHTPMV